MSRTRQPSLERVAAKLFALRAAGKRIELTDGQATVLIDFLYNVVGVKKHERFSEPYLDGLNRGQAAYRAAVQRLKDAHPEAYAETGEQHTGSARVKVFTEMYPEEFDRFKFEERESRGLHFPSFTDVVGRGFNHEDNPIKRLRDRLASIELYAGIGLQEGARVDRCLDGILQQCREGLYGNADPQSNGDPQAVPEIAETDQPQGKGN